MADDNRPIEVGEMRVPWEQLENEGLKAFEAFSIYRDMGKDRTVRKVAQQLNKSLTQIGKWSSKYNWVDRVTAYEAEIDRQAAQKHMKDIATMRARQAKQALMMQLKGMKFINALNFDEEKGPISDVRLSEIVQLMKYASETERICMGDVGEVVEERDGGVATPAVQIYIPDNNRDRADDGDDE